MKIDTEILCSFIDGELDEQAAGEVRAALETDQSLRQEYEGLYKTAQMVRSLPRVPAPPDLAAMITAHSERSQLLGGTEAEPSRPSKFRWTLSMAASLLIGASLGILGYHSWPERVEPSRETSELVVAAGDEYKLKDSPEIVLAPSPKAGPSGESGYGFKAAMQTDSEGAGEEIAANLPISGRKTGYVGKGGGGIARRSGPAQGAPARSRGGAYLGSAEAREFNEQMQEGIVDALKSPRKEALQGAGQDAVQALGYYRDGSRSALGSAEPSEDARTDEISEQSELAKKENISLGLQVLSNNYVNQSMAANLKFEAEPLNVKVVSKDSAKTLLFVQQWARSNFLIDLNRASRESNFPAFSQVVYQGQAGTNTDVDIKNSIFVRTTRGQARDIVSQLQMQKTVVLSVVVKDAKNQLGDLAGQRAQQQSFAVSKPRVLFEMDTDEKRDLKLKSKLATVDDEASHKRLRAPANGHLYFLSNQAQVVSLEDLVTLVVLVEDAPLASKAEDAPAATSPATIQPSLPESQTKPK